MMQVAAAIPVPNVEESHEMKYEKRKKIREKRDEKMRNEIITKYNPHWNLMCVCVLIVLFVYGARALKLN